MDFWQLPRPYNRSLVRVVIVLMLIAVPLKLLVDSYVPGHGFLSLVHFGERFSNTRLSEINELEPPTQSPIGCDGQFYAQLALHPSLGGEDIANALDNPAYRARRIGLPVLAMSLGLGRTAWVLNIYSMLNFVFWLLLLVLLLRFIGLRRRHHKGNFGSEFCRFTSAEQRKLMGNAGNAGMAWMLVKTTSILHLAIWL